MEYLIEMHGKGILVLGQLLYRKERGKISRFDMREEVAIKLFISRFQGGFDGHWSWST